MGAFPWDRRCLRPVLAVGLTALAVPFVGGPWLLQLGLIGLAYAATALAVGAVRPAELRALLPGASAEALARD